MAIWDARFAGSAGLDYEKIVVILRKHPRVEVHPFNSKETARSNPFIAEIEKDGIEIPVGEA